MQIWLLRSIGKNGNKADACKNQNVKHGLFLWFVLENMFGHKSHVRIDHFHIWLVSLIVRKLSYADIVAMGTQQPWQQMMINFIRLSLEQLRPKLVC